MGPNLSPAKIKMMFNIEIIGFLVVGCCDFIAQSILVRTAYPAYHLLYIDDFVSNKKIYRCWIVWGHNIRVVILPIILVFAFLGPSNLSNLSLFTRLISNS